MKKILIIAIFTIAILQLNAQKTAIELPIDSSTHKISFSDVVSVPNASKDQLFESLRTFIASTSLIKEKSITINDKNTYEVTVQCKDPLNLFFAGQSVSFCNLKYSVTLYVKDNRFKYYIRDFIHEGCVRGGGYDVMKSIGELERVLDVDRDRGFYDHVLQLAKEQALRVVQGIKSAALNSKEKDF